MLVVAPSWVGDLVMAQPLLAAVRRARPDAGIDVLAPAGLLPLVRRLPEVAEALASPFRHGRLDLAGRWRLGRELSRRGYGQAFVLPNSFKSALLPWFAGIPRRTGFTGEFRHGVINDRRTFDASRVPRLVDRYLLLADASDTTDPRPRLRHDPAATAAVVARLGLSPDRPVACLCPGAEYGPAKRWPARHFAALADRLIGAGFTVWLLGSEKDRPVTGAIAAAMTGPVADLAGRTDLGEAADLLAAAAVVVCNDSGLMHVAAALDRPLVALFGSSSPDYTPPLSPRARVARHPVPCSPCFRRECPLGHLDCLERLEPGPVLDLALNAMESRP